MSTECEATAAQIIDSPLVSSAVLDRELDDMLWGSTGRSTSCSTSCGSEQENQVDDELQEHASLDRKSPPQLTLNQSLEVASRASLGDSKLEDKECLPSLAQGHLHEADTFRRLLWCTQAKEQSSSQSLEAFNRRRNSVQSKLQKLAALAQTLEHGVAYDHSVGV